MVMSNLGFSKAVKERAKLRLAIDGPAGSGKTWTALTLATTIAKNEGGRIAVLDTERGSASLYADCFDFDVVELTNFNPRNYTNVIHSAEKAGIYSVLVLDSLTHAWDAEGGALDLVDQASKRNQGENRFVGWKDVTPLQREMVDAMLQSTLHIVATMRSKMEYIIEKDPQTGKNTVKKVGMAPIQRQGLEYEFSLVADMDTNHNFIVSKTRIAELDNWVKLKPTADDFQVIMDWLKSGAEPVKKTTYVPPAPEKPVPAPVKAEPKDVSKIQRPYSPVQLSERLQQIADASDPGNVDDMVRVGAIVNDMIDSTDIGAGLLPSDIYQYLTGEGNLDQMDKKHVSAYMKWLNPKRVEGQWVTDQTAQTEILAVIQALVAAREVA